MTTTYAFESGATRELSISVPPEEIRVVGLDEEGRVVVRYYGGEDGKGGWLFGLTLCCNASDKGMEHGIECRACYGTKPNADRGMYDPEIVDPVKEG